MNNLDGLQECPHCQVDLEKELDRIFRAHDYPMNFNVVCPKCDKSFNVDVISIPEFWTGKKVDPMDETYKVSE